jgi:hypothetical protein
MGNLLGYLRGANRNEIISSLVNLAASKHRRDAFVRASLAVLAISHRYLQSSVFFIPGAKLWAVKKWSISSNILNVPLLDHGPVD